MSDTSNDRSETSVGDPEGEWDSVVRRISERIKKRSGGAATTQSSLDLASDLVRLERRAIEAEAALEREREGHGVRTREMEDKLRKLEPWLRQLKSEYQKAATERDRLRDELARVQKNAAGPSAADLSKTSVLESEKEAAFREAEAARAARDAALAEAESLRRRIDNEEQNAQSSSDERIAAAEKARDQALEDVKQMRKAAGDGRRAEEEVRRLLKQIEQLETTTAAHKAVARAAQEAVETAQARLTEIEKAQQKKAEAVQHESQRSQDLAKQLDDARDEIAAAERKRAEAESTAEAVRGGEEHVRRELDVKAQALLGVRAELDQSNRTIEKLRAETAEASRLTELARADAAGAQSQAAQTRSEACSAADELARVQGALDAAKAAGQKTRDESAANQRDAAMAKELADEAMKAEEEARRRADATAEKLAAAEQELAAASQRLREAASAAQEAADHAAAEQRGRADAELRANDLDARLAQAELRVPELESELEMLKGRAHALQTEASNLTRTLDDDRQSATKRFDAAETSWRSQMRAAESRFEADVHRERDRTREVEAMLRAIEERHAASQAGHEADLSQLRASAMQFVAAKSQELISGIHRIVGDEPVVVPPITASMDPEVLFPPPTVAMGKPLAAGGDWDRLINDVEQLWTEVEGMRQDGATAREDTDSMAPEDAAALAPAGALAEANPVTPDSQVFDPAQPVPAMAATQPIQAVPVQPVADERTAEIEGLPAPASDDSAAAKRRRRRR